MPCVNRINDTQIWLWRHCLQRFHYIGVVDMPKSAFFCLRSLRHVLWPWTFFLRQVATKCALGLPWDLTGFWQRQRVFTLSLLHLWQIHNRSCCLEMLSCSRGVLNSLSVAVFVVLTVSRRSLWNDFSSWIPWPLSVNVINTQKKSNTVEIILNSILLLMHPVKISLQTLHTIFHYWETELFILAYLKVGARNV